MSIDYSGLCKTVIVFVKVVMFTQEKCVWITNRFLSLLHYVKYCSQIVGTFSRLSV